MAVLLISTRLISSGGLRFKTAAIGVIIPPMGVKGKCAVAIKSAIG
jgi:hypothetical protein